MPRVSAFPTAQHIIHSGYTNVSPLFDDLERLYMKVSRKDQPNKGMLFQYVLNNTFDESFRPLCELLGQYVYYLNNIEFANANYPVLDVSHPDKTMIVCFSGGKDSIATALLYKKMGYDVRLFHVHGINVTYFDEFMAVKRLAEVMDLPLHIENVVMKGTHIHTEHPMKNILIANAAVNYGITNNLGTEIAFGNFDEASLVDNEFEVCAGDCVEMWEVYNHLMQSILPGFKIHTILPRNEESLNMLASNPELLKYSDSCITPYRYKKLNADKNREKYNIELADYYCGSCWKCCMDYIYFADHNIYVYNKNFYRHCLAVLNNTVFKETGEWPNSVDELWKRYFFYDMRNSKDKEIFYAAIRHKWIKWPEDTEQSAEG